MMTGYDTELSGFVVKNIRVHSGAETFSVPQFAFERRGRRRYTPWTTRILDLGSSGFPRKKCRATSDVFAAFVNERRGAAAR